VGATVVVAHYAGQRKIKEANEAVKQAMFAGICLSFMITLVILIFRNPILGFLFGSAEQKVMANLHIYLNITLITYPFIAMTAIISGVLRGAGDTKTPMKVSMIMNVINIIMSYVLIYGIHLNNHLFSFNIAGRGITGAAIGIAIARTLGATIMLLIAWRGSSIIKLTEIRSFRIKMHYLRSIFSIGIPASLENLMFNGGKLLTQIFIVGMGTTATASNFIASSIASLINVPGSALGIVIVTMVGQSMGKRDTKEAGEIMLYLVKFSSVCLLILSALVFPSAGFLVSLYSKDPEIIAMASNVIRTLAVATPLFWSQSFVLPSGLRGAGDARYTMVTAIFGMWAFRITLGYILGVTLGLGVQGVWMGMYADWIVRGTLYLIRLKGGKWKLKTVIKPES